MTPGDEVIAEKEINPETQNVFSDVTPFKTPMIVVPKDVQPLLICIQLGWMYIFYQGSKPSRL